MGSQEHGFSDLLRTDNYLFHVHTNFTDGTSSVEDYCHLAEQRGLRGVVFTEHVRTECTYDFDSLVTEVSEVRMRFPRLKIILGVEAKLMPTGVLDISEEVASKVELLGIACHRFPYAPDVYVDTVQQVLSTYSNRFPACVWLHPGAYFRLQAEPDWTSLAYLIDLAVDRGIYIEYNCGYQLPPLGLWRDIPKDKRVIGVNAHSVEGADQVLTDIKRGVFASAEGAIRID